MQHVARVVCDTEDNTLVARHIPYAAHDLLGTGARKDVTADSSRQHTVAHVARPRGLVARATPRYDSDLVRLVCSVVYDSLLGIEGHVLVPRDEGGEGMHHDALGAGEEVLPRHNGQLGMRSVTVVPELQSPEKYLLQLLKPPVIYWAWCICKESITLFRAVRGRYGSENGNAAYPDADETRPARCSRPAKCSERPGGGADMERKGKWPASYGSGYELYIKPPAAPRPAPPPRPLCAELAAHFAYLQPVNRASARSPA
jgi:hypothetical protein